MAIVKDHEFDKNVARRIKEYLKKNDYVQRKVAAECGMTMNQFYQMINNHQLIKLREYVAICNAVKEPLEFFLHD